MSGTASTPTSNDGFRPFAMNDRVRTSNQHAGGPNNPTLTKVDDVIPRGRERQREGSADLSTTPVRCINPASDVNARLDTQVEVRVYPCNNSQGGGKKKFTTFTIKPEVRDITSSPYREPPFLFCFTYTISFLLYVRASLFKDQTAVAMPTRSIWDPSTPCISEGSSSDMSCRTPGLVNFW
jgi:hypothetical protein